MNHKEGDHTMYWITIILAVIGLGIFSAIRNQRIKRKEDDYRLRMDAASSRRFEQLRDERLQREYGKKV